MNTCCTTCAVYPKCRLAFDRNPDKKCHLYIKDDNDVKSYRSKKIDQINTMEDNEEAICSKCFLNTLCRDFEKLEENESCYFFVPETINSRRV